MSERAPSEIDQRIDDPVKAEHMAYGEKPFRDDAHKLGEMATRAKAAGENDKFNPFIDEEQDYGTPSERHEFGLRQAQETAIVAANAAGEKVERSYDDAEMLRQQAEEAQQTLDRSVGNPQ